MRWTVLFVFIGVASAVRGFGVPVIYSTGIAVFAGCVGIMIIWFVSKRRHVAMHCSSYCPAGTLVMYLKYVSPWRLHLNDRCRHCMACMRVCRYGALSKADVLKGRPAQLYLVWGLPCGVPSRCLRVSFLGNFSYIGGTSLVRDYTGTFHVFPFYCPGLNMWKKRLYILFFLTYISA